jgi:sulfatase modifying factor 1
MAYVPGGRTRIGAEDGLPAERPVFTVDVPAFFLDVHPVTVAAFRRFVEETGYRTDAERFGSAGVFDPATRAWHLVEGATWRQPFGPVGPAAPGDHPVTQVSWHDAAAYAAWAGKRLPTEVEWEHAARGARDAREPYAWGPALVEDGRYRANTWQGTFPARNTGADGYLYTSPVGAFGETALGLTDLGGNVWEWTADWFRPYDQRSRPFIPDETSERVQRGGSFLCHASYCHGYRVSARSHSTPETSLFHVGFRCAKDVETR